MYVLYVIKECLYYQRVFFESSLPVYVILALLVSITAAGYEYMY